VRAEDRRPRIGLAAAVVAAPCLRAPRRPWNQASVPRCRAVALPSERPHAPDTLPPSLAGPRRPHAFSQRLLEASTGERVPSGHRTPRGTPSPYGVNMQLWQWFLIRFTLAWRPRCSGRALPPRSQIAFVREAALRPGRRHGIPGGGPTSGCPVNITAPASRARCAPGSPASRCRGRRIRRGHRSAHW